MPSLNPRLGEINARIGLQQIAQMEKFKKKDKILLISI